MSHVRLIVFNTSSMALVPPKRTSSAGKLEGSIRKFCGEAQVSFTCLLFTAPSKLHEKGQTAVRLTYAI